MESWRVSRRRISSRLVHPRISLYTNYSQFKAFKLKL
jgi:hypothetical protein